MTTFEALVKLQPYWVCLGHCGAYAGEDAISYIHRSRAEIEWIYHRVLENNESTNSKDEALLKELFDRYYLLEATMFSIQSTQYCMKLLVRRILEAKGSLNINHREKKLDPSMIKRMDHINMVVSDIEQAKAFFMDLGFEES
jgi:adenylate cyclase class IV